jgi:FtsP/CotA-like multicopper oxidase with cupredoxin domain
MQSLEPKIWQLPNRCGKSVWVVGIALTIVQPVIASELVEPPICSAATAGQPHLAGICFVKPLGNGRNDVQVSLTAASAQIDVGGYKITTGNYNGNFLAPVVEAMPGDTVSAHLFNTLLNGASSADTHNHGTNLTNLHYFHGGIVSPNNSRPGPAELGNGDNIYVDLKSGLSFDFKVPIPGETSVPGNEMLDARVLESPGFIPHPRGLNWYHSHRHGISANQVMGGMSGLLSVGEATDNVKADCKDPNDTQKCLDDTNELKRKTMVRYALLRDIPLANIAKLPSEANGDAATWDLTDDARDFPKAKPCGVWKADGSGPDPDPNLRLGFCQRTDKTALLFTVNGQRYPTITVEGGKNLLLRLGNVSANVPYWLELQDEADPTKQLPITILSLDGVVPALPLAPGQAQKPVKAVDYKNVLMMPAMRAEIYVRNDEAIHTKPRAYILRTKKHVVRLDEWPEIQLARIVLEPNVATSAIAIALNRPVATGPVVSSAAHAVEKAAPPPGCVRDLNPELNEFRRVTFMGFQPDWSVKTEIVTPQPILQKQSDHHADPKATIGAPDGSGLSFEAYLGNDGLVDWTTPKHVCIFLDHVGSHQQLWVLVNSSANLHNFHIHQMKFRLATAQELRSHFVEPPALARTCAQDPCPGDTPNYDLYDDQQTPGDIDPGATRRWHDTIPLPPKQEVYVVMSFDARQQIGRFVFHCHILRHEDNGLMAPIEVLPSSGLVLQ